MRTLLVASGSPTVRETTMGEVFVGHDWAEDHHDVHVQDGQGKRLAAARLPDGVEGVARLHGLLADHVDDPGQVVVATETDRGLFVLECQVPSG